MNQSFETQSGAVTHDSDVRRLPFVFRNRTTGVEESISLQQVIDGLTPNPELLPLKYAEPGGTTAVWTEPLELRNRNRAAFELVFDPPNTVTAWQVEPVLGGYEDYSATVQMMSPGTAAWGFQTHDTEYTGTPIAIHSATAPAVGYLNILTLTIVNSVTAEGSPWLRGTLTETATGRILLERVDLMAPGGTAYQISAGYYLDATDQTLTWLVESSDGFFLDQIPSGSFRLNWRVQEADVTPIGLPIDYTEVSSGTSSVVEHITPTGTFDGTMHLTRVRGVVTIPFGASVGPYHEYHASMTLDGTPLWSGRIDIPTSESGNTPIVYDSGVIDIPYINPGVSNLLLTVWDAVGAPLLQLESGQIDFNYEWKLATVTPAAEWIFSEQMYIVAFASIDGEKYTPISMARHDWSNTPFVDIMKFEPLVIPDDFYQVPPLPPLALQDKLICQHSILMFLTDFDNAATWNYIRFLIEWNGATEGPNNGNATMAIVCNAREI
jgi:hypothetical protein